MRKYKSLTIPDRKSRTGDYIIDKQTDYCYKSDCEGKPIQCVSCLFCYSNILEFKEWYLQKNKRRRK